MNDNMIALSELALEIGGTADDLAAKLGDRVRIDDIGRRCVERSLAGVMIAADRAEKQAQHEREQQRRAQSAARLSEARASVLAIRQQLKARGEAQQDLISTGVPAGDVVRAGDYTERVQASSARMDEMLRADAELTYHPVRRRD